MSHQNKLLEAKSALSALSCGFLEVCSASACGKDPTEPQAVKAAENLVYRGPVSFTTSHSSTSSRGCVQTQKCAPGLLLVWTEPPQGSHLGHAGYFWPTDTQRVWGGSRQAGYKGPRFCSKVHGRGVTKASAREGGTGHVSQVFS